jgi:hypothetical protein
MINTFSKFYYLGTEIIENNNRLFIDEGNGELEAEVTIGSYTIAGLCLALKSALNAVGDLSYSVEFDRETRLITISASGTFSVLRDSGAYFSAGIYGLIGFDGAENLTGLDAYTGGQVAGQAYEPQFKLQSFVSSDDLQEAVDAVINETASGQVEVVKFGIRRFVEMNISFATDVDQGSGGVILSNPTGVADLRRFMQFLVTKSPVEFMPDKDSPEVFQNLLLESTPESSKGTGYRLRELYDRSLPGYFETGLLKFRVV